MDSSFFVNRSFYLCTDVSPRVGDSAHGEEGGEVKRPFHELFRITGSGFSALGGVPVHPMELDEDGRRRLAKLFFERAISLYGERDGKDV